MIVREATRNDIESIASFQVKMAAETEDFALDTDTVLAGVSAVVADNKKGRYYVTEIEGKVVASLLTTFEWSDWRNGTILWIQSVYVLPEFRRKGIYRNLYTHIKSIVQADKNLNGIRLYADKNNHPAQNTYRQLGMSAEHYVTFEWMK